MKVIIGLGNPGRGYMRTRHNIGFMALKSFADRLGKPRLRKKTTSFLREDYRLGAGEITLIRPLMYMNLSGEALRKTGLNWDALISETLVIYDEAGLDFGRIRIRTSGSAGGHKGMRNIIDVFGTQDIARLRLGVGSDPEFLLEDYVLKPFLRQERKELPAFLDCAADAVQSILDDGIESAMNAYNPAPAADE